MFCRFHKFMISNALDGGKPLGRLTRRHLQRCHACNRFLDLCRTMDQRLRVERVEFHNAVQPVLSRRVLDASPIQAGPSKRFTKTMRPWLAAAACIAILAVPAILLVMRSAPPAPDQRYQQAAELAASLYDSGTLFAARIANDPLLLPSAVEAPVRNEIRNVAADTESAVRFVVASVPVTPVPRQVSN